MTDRDSIYGSPAYFYQNFYDQVICQRGFGKSGVARTHRAMEKPYRGLHFDRCLELGSGRGEHLEYVEHTYNTWLMIDIRNGLEGTFFEDGFPVHFLIGDAQKIPVRDHSIDRLIVTCLLHHVTYPEETFEEINRCLSTRNSVGTIFLPCDPGLVVRLLRSLTTSRLASRLGFKGYGLMIAREHRNHVGSLLEIAQHVFCNRHLKVRYFPFRIRSWNLNAYIVLTVGEVQE
jgi:SAM-dependent methyltransferase